MDDQDRQREIEEAVRWYAPILGLAHWAFEVRWGGKMVNGDEFQAEVSRDPCHRAAIVTVTDGVLRNQDGRWKGFLNPERSVVHELMHTAMVNYEIAVTHAVAEIPDKKVRKLLTAAIDREEERFVDAMAAALIAAAYADRNSPPPALGGIVPRTDLEAE